MALPTLDDAMKEMLRVALPSARWWLARRHRDAVEAQGEGSNAIQLSRARRLEETERHLASCDKLLGWLDRDANKKGHR